MSIQNTVYSGIIIYLFIIVLFTINNPLLPTPVCKIFKTEKKKSFPGKQN